MKSKFGFDRVIKNLERTKKTLLAKLSEASKEHFIKENFSRQQFDGVKWKQPQRQIDSKTFGKKNKKGKLIGGRENSATLVQSGRLRRAVINMQPSFTDSSLTLRVEDVVYAKVHNEGLKAGRGRGFIMPKRQFVGQDKKLTLRQQIIIKTTIDKIWSE